MAGDVAGLVRGQLLPGVPLGVGLDPLPGGADQEVVDVHAGHDLVQRPGDVDAQAALGRLAVPDLGVVTGVAESSWSRAATRPRRASKSRSARDFCSEPSEPGRSWLKYSRFPQKSKT